MTNFDPANPNPPPLGVDLRQVLRNRFVLLLIAAIAIFLTAKFNWGWLVAAGIAPLVLSAGPCIAMCAIGLCMQGEKKSPVDKKIVLGDGTPSAPIKGENAISAKSHNDKGCC